MMAGDQGFSLAITCMGGNLGYFERKTKHCHQAKEKNTGYFFTSLPTEKNINSPKNTQILLHLFSWKINHSWNSYRTTSGTQVPSEDIDNIISCCVTVVWANSQWKMASDRFVHKITIERKLHGLEDIKFYFLV